MASKHAFKKTYLSIAAALVLSGGASLTAMAQNGATIIGNDLNAIVGVDDNIRDFLSANRGTNGGGDQSLQHGDAISGTEQNDILIGALGIDVLFGEGGDDIIIGGTEDFNPFNRDRAFGGAGEDTFLWAPGDGNDYFDGGDGLDVVMLGLIGEQRGAAEGLAAFFGVNPPTGEGSQDFDGIFISSSSGLPLMNIGGGPGFCEVVDGSGGAAEQAELEALDVDHLVRFILRGPAADTSSADTGLRIALHIEDTEYLVCGGVNPGDTVALDLRTSPPTPIDVSQLPARAFNLLFTPPPRIERLR